MLKVNEELINIAIELNIEFPEYWDATNPADIQKFIVANDCCGMDELRIKLEDFNANKQSALTKDDIKSVYVMLKNREIHPSGDFDKQGRFYLSDAELVDVRTPSTKYPYSQMNAGRGAKFVKAMADKYGCQNVGELVSRFKKA
jgi:hypothetical protein